MHHVPATQSQGIGTDQGVSDLSLGNNKAVTIVLPEGDPFGETSLNARVSFLTESTLNLEPRLISDLT